MTDPIFRNDIGAYTGIGQPLSIAQFDGNTLLFHERLNDIEAALAAGKVFDDPAVSYTETSITFHFTDDTSVIVPLPVARLRPAGAWANATPYTYGDLVTVPLQGTWLVLIDHTTPATPAAFDPEAVDETTDDGGPLYYQMTPGSDVAYDVAFAIVGNLPDFGTGGTAATGESGSLIGQFILPRPVTMDGAFAGSYAYLDTTAFTDDVVLSIEHNGVEVGTITFATGENDGVFAAVGAGEDIEFVAGDRVTLRLIVSDEIAADMAVTLVGTRTDV